MTNPNNAIGTNGAYGGRTSVEAFNDDLAIFKSRGVLSGFQIVPSSSMTVALGGDGTTRDVAIAEDNIGNRTTINNISGSPIPLTVGGAPASNTRIDAVVAYVENPPQGTSSATDNPGVCGLILVEGAAASTPVKPDDAAIRTAITGDGASGTNAYYAILGYITVASGTTTITSNMIENMPTVETNTELQDGSITTAKIADSAITSAKIASNSVSNAKISNNTIAVGKLNWSTLCSPSADTTTTTMGATYTKFYGCNNSIRSAFGGHGFDFSGFLDFGGTSGQADVNKTAIPGMSGYYGFKTNTQVPTTPSVAMLYQNTGFSWAYTPGSDVPASKLAPVGGTRHFAVGTDGYIYLDANQSSTITVYSWQRVQFRYPGGIHLIDK